MRQETLGTFRIKKDKMFTFTIKMTPGDAWNIYSLLIDLAALSEYTPLRKIAAQIEHQLAEMRAEENSKKIIKARRRLMKPDTLGEVHQ